jgi:phosphohistidine swiveling domain-containing protein
MARRISNRCSPATFVAAITTPAWTPLFAMAAGVVTMGGPLSHGSIVAREYGIPAVLGTGVATRRIHSGQVITVDGSNGTVTLEAGERIKLQSWLPLIETARSKRPVHGASICELLPDPLTPLLTPLGMQSIENGINVMSKDLFDMPLISAGFMLAINGYTYQKVSFTPRQWWYILSRMMPRMPRYCGGCILLAKCRPPVCGSDSPLAEADPANLSSTEIWQVSMRSWLACAPPWFFDGQHHGPFCR